MRIELAGANRLGQECVIFRAGDVNGAAKIPGFDNGTFPVHRAFEPIGADSGTTREDRLRYGSQVLCLDADQPVEYTLRSGQGLGYRLTGKSTSEELI